MDRVLLGGSGVFMKYSTHQYIMWLWIKWPSYFIYSTFFNLSWDIHPIVGSHELLSYVTVAYLFHFVSMFFSLLFSPRSNLYNLLFLLWIHFMWNQNHIDPWRWFYVLYRSKRSLPFGEPQEMFFPLVTFPYSNQFKPVSAYVMLIVAD